MFTVHTLTSVINQLLPEPHAGLLAGLLFGTKASLSREFYNALVVSGTLHIVALSGMNITIIADMFAKGLLWVVSRRIASLLTLVGIIWFVWFVGPSPSIVRAAIMGSITLLAIIFGRQNWALLTWTLAVGIMLLLNFLWLTDVSFQLSALATLGIILFGPSSGAGEVGVHFPPGTVRGSLFAAHRVTGFEKTRRAVPWFWDFLRNDLRLTLAAQVFTIPLILFHFHRISLISPVANILIGWLLAPLTVLGWATAVIGWIFLPLGQILAWVDWVLLQYLITVVLWTSNIPFASLGK